MPATKDNYKKADINKNVLDDDAFHHRRSDDADNLSSQLSVDSFNLRPACRSHRQSSSSISLSVSKASTTREHVMSSAQESPRLHKLTVPQLKELIAEERYDTSDLKSKPLKQDLVNLILQCRGEDLIQGLDDIVDEQKATLSSESSAPLPPSSDKTARQSPIKHPMNLPNLKTKLLHQGIDQLQDFQLTVNQRIQQGDDVVLQAPTGTGKTLAYVLPYLTKCSDGSEDITSKTTRYGWSGKLLHDKKVFIAKPRILVLAPSRELAQQIGSVWKTFGASSVTTFGGVPVERHVSLLVKEAPYVLISTPGRLRELCRKNFVQLDKLDALILDEADVLLDANDSPDVLQIIDDIGAVQTEYQLILASATYNEHSKSFLRDMGVSTSALVKVEDGGVSVEAASDRFQSKSARPLVQHWHCSCTTSARSKVSAALLEMHNPNLTIIFVARKSGTEDVAEYLNAQTSGRNIHVLHGDMNQALRSRTISSISSRKINKPTVLVATDVASRGLDLPNVDMVIQFGIPTMAGKEHTYNPDLYIHRTGRAGRMGHQTNGNRSSSNTILLYDPALGEGKLLSNLVAEVERSLRNGLTINAMQIPSSKVVASAKYKRALQSIRIPADDVESKKDKANLDQWEARVINDLGEEVTNTPKALRRYLANAIIQLADLNQHDSTIQEYSLLSGSSTERTLIFRRRDDSQSSLAPSEVTLVCKALGSGKLGRVSISRGAPSIAV
eukprot:CAMPEP_0113470640 /NCGR_PEP_ID=MMETSP0014_2-20120614/16551_1 /TAXON_ID=2857 /ORGANISM="Nitzschia sp." /LENGTH=727 /DNA_ID=CAMNT_0000363219 /DNA_START=94 /DNA_END=2275 /DNA_ORIENTATION=- /assembly_acc=CAM_ASM_000159